MVVKKDCPFCGQSSQLEISEENYKRYLKYREGYGYIQDIPLPAEQREFLKTGMCQRCQNWMFEEEVI